MFRRRRLPHWDLPGATYFITACLADSIPAQGWLSIHRFRDELLATRPRDQSPEWKAEVWKRTFFEQEKWLDVDAAGRHLENPALAAVVEQSLLHFDGERYYLVGYVVMPSHFHWLFHPRDEWAAALPAGKSPRQVIMQSIKSYTAHECNKLLNRSGPFWQQESFDHCVLDEDEMERILEYIEFNPVKGGLCKQPEEWKFSSAHRRVVG